MLKTYKYRLKDRSAAKHLRQHAYAVNQVYNWCVAQHRDTLDRYRAGSRPRDWKSKFDLVTQCKGLGKELGINQQTVQEACEYWIRNRSINFRRSFGLNRKRGWVPFQQQSRQTSGNSVTYCKKPYRWFGNKRRPLPEGAKGGEFFEDSRGRWWVCFRVEAPDPLPENGPAVGIDLGLKTLATLSDGQTIDNIRPLRKWSDKLAVAQRSRNKQRTRAIHTKIANVRKDYLHKVTTRLARSHALIAVGNVNASNLAKTKMAKSVLDAGWSALRTMLKYKSAGYVEVDERFTTQTCSGCGSIAGPKGRAGLNKRAWDCPTCGVSHDRDVNAARVILARALSAQGHVDESRRAA